MQVGRVWRSLWSLYSDQQHQLQLRLHTSMEVEMPKITWDLKQHLFNEIYDSSSNLCTRNLCPLPLSGDYLDPTNLVITCPLIPFMRIFLRFRSCLIFLVVLHIPRKSKYCRRMKTVDPTLLLHEQTFINPVTSLCSKIHRNESLLKSMCDLFGGEIKELLKSQQIGHETFQKNFTF